MFDFDLDDYPDPVDPNLDPSTARGRFKLRIKNHRDQGVSVLRHHFWWFVHNCIAHILIGVCPVNVFFRFHDYTSRKINLVS